MSKPYIIQYTVPLESGNQVPVYAIYDDEDSWMTHNEVKDYMLDDFSSKLNQSGLLKNDNVDDIIEANFKCNKIPKGSITVDLRGDKLSTLESISFYISK
jgi:hypothetical protein